MFLVLFAGGNMDGSRMLRNIISANQNADNPPESSRPILVEIIISAIWVARLRASTPLMIWDSIIEVIFTFWESFTLANDGLKLVTTGNKDIAAIRKELEYNLFPWRPLNMKIPRHTEFRKFGVKNRTRLVMKDKKVITKHALMEKA